jgi:hypothetical protein
MAASFCRDFGKSSVNCWSDNEMASVAAGSKKLESSEASVTAIAICIVGFVSLLYE